MSGDGTRTKTGLESLAEEVAPDEYDSRRDEMMPEPDEPRFDSRNGPTRRMTLDNRDILERVNRLSEVLTAGKIPSTATTIHALALLVSNLLRRSGQQKHEAVRLFRDMWDLDEKSEAAAAEAERAAAKAESKAPDA